MTKRITISLVTEVDEAMERLKEATGRSSTDIANRGILLYELAQRKQINEDFELVFRTPSGTIEPIHFL